MNVDDESIAIIMLQLKRFLLIILKRFTIKESNK